MSKFITLTGNWWWIDIHHLWVRHVLRNVWVSVVDHPFCIRMTKKDGREGARGKGIWTWMGGKLDESRRMNMFRTLLRRLWWC